MELTDKFYHLIFNNMLNGFSFHQIVLDDHGNPIDYVFIEVNKAFENLTGLKRESILGKRVTEVLPGIEHSEFDWIGFYGQVALNGTKETFMQYSEALGKWYSVCVYSHEKSYFITVFNDITEIKQKEQTLIRQNEEISALYEELTASEEELKQQVEELREYSDLIKANEDRLNRSQAIAHVGNWELDLMTQTLWTSKEAFKLYGIRYESPFLPLKWYKALSI